MLVDPIVPALVEPIEPELVEPMLLVDPIELVAIEASPEGGTAALVSDGGAVAAVLAELSGAVAEAVSLVVSFFWQPARATQPRANAATRAVDLE